MKNVCIIPARGGSKRIPRKNIKLFYNKPIIAYSIEAALNSDCFDKIIVSTDDEEIADVANKYGAETPFIRPEELANDYTPTVPVIKHAINWLSTHNDKPDNVCCIYATAPFITAKIIQEAFALMQKNNAGYCFTAAKFSFPIQRAFKILENSRVAMFQPENYNVRSQDLEPAYQDAGQLYWGKSESFLLDKPFLSNISVPYILASHLVQDIDTFDDWDIAEILYKNIKR